MVTPAGEVRLLDFGIAKLLDGGLSDGSAPAPERTGTGMRAFTLHYAAPEQIRGEPITTMTDVYSLGVVLYELLTDRRPYRLKRHSDAEWEEAILTADPIRPSASLLSADALRDTATTGDRQTHRRRSRVLAGDLDNITLKALAKRPEHRYPSVEALGQDIRRYRSGRPVQARPQKLGYRLRKFVARHRWSLSAALLAMAVLAAALTLIAWQARQAVAEAARAQAMQDFMVGLFENAGGRDSGEPMDLDQLLDDAVARGDQQLAREPRARAELLGVIARLHANLGNPARAQALLVRQAEIIERAGDIPNSLRLESLTQRGRVSRLLGDPAACIELMQPEQALARREQARLPPQVAAFHTQLGRCRRAVGETQAARQSFERALAVRRAIGDDEAGMVETLMDLAQLQAGADPAAALVAYEQARHQLHQRLGGGHALNIRLGRELAALQAKAGRMQPARQSLQQALQVALDLHGPDHEQTLAVRRQLAEVLFDASRFDDADRQLREVARLRKDRLGPDDPGLVRDQVRLGRIAWERDDLPTALAELREALRIARLAKQPDAEIRSLVALAGVLRGAGRAGAARPVLLEAQQLRDAQPDGDAGNDIEWMLGDVEVALGDTLTGQARLQQSLALAQHRYGEDRSGALRVEVAAMRPLALAGDMQAMARLDAIAARQDLVGHGHRQRAISWQAVAAAAAARCRNGKAEGGATALADLAEHLQAEQPDGSALRREVDALRLQCTGT
jgi:serine/threonine-protein kinase